LSSFTFNKHDQYAGEVFGKQVSFQELRIFESLTRLLPPSPQILENPQTAYAFAWQQLILSREAKSKQIEVSDDEVRVQVDQLINARQPGGRVSPGEYAALLKSWRTTPYEFETGIREMIRIQKMAARHFESMPRSAPLPEEASEEARKKALEDLQALSEESYRRWIIDIYTRAQWVDYNQLSQKTSVMETEEDPA